MDEDRITRDMDITRWRDGSTTRGPDTIAEEAIVTFHVEPMGILEIVMTPGSLHEFILGHLFCEGLVRDREGISDVTIADRGDRLEVLVELAPSLIEEATAMGTFDGSHRRGLIQTECGGLPPWPVRSMEPVEGRLGMTAGNIAGIPRAVRDRTRLFEETGAFHYAFLLTREGEPVQQAFDVGRHTAVDKVVGKALSAGKGLEANALYTTGRISSDVAHKCIHARIPLVISRGAPLTGAIGIARENDLGMVGFLREGRFNVYAGEHHVDWD